MKSIVIYYSRAGYNYVNGENALEKSLPGELKKEIGLPTTLTEIGITDKNMLKQVADSSNITKGCCKQLTHEEIYEILMECL